MAKRKVYSEDFKINAVKMVTEGGMKQTQVSRNLGVNPNSIWKWVKQYGNQTSTDISKEEALSKARLFEKELIELREENEILKKAAAYFAKNQK